MFISRCPSNLHRHSSFVQKIPRANSRPLLHWQLASGIHNSLTTLVLLATSTIIQWATSSPSHSELPLIPSVWRAVFVFLDLQAHTTHATQGPTHWTNLPSTSHKILATARCHQRPCFVNQAESLRLPNGARRRIRFRHATQTFRGPGLASKTCPTCLHLAASSWRRSRAHRKQLQGRQGTCSRRTGGRCYDADMNWLSCILAYLYTYLLLKKDFWQIE